jgi:hypothetical protein
MDPFRIGLAVVAIAGGVALLSAAFSALVGIILDLIPSALILAFIFWVLKGMVRKLLD